MSRQGYNAIGSVLLPGDFDPATLPLEATEDIVWLSRTTRCRRYTFRGVPARRIDVAVEYGEQRDPAADEGWVCSVGRKTGRFDGAERPRLTFRRYRTGMQVGMGTCAVVGDGAAWAISVRDAAGTSLFEERLDRLRSDLNDYAHARLVIWRVTRYFSHLFRVPEDGGLGDAGLTDFADAFCIPPECGTLAEANRVASRYCYTMSRALGWAKLPARERE